MSGEHHIKRRNLIPVKINLSKIMEDMPDTELIVAETIPLHMTGENTPRRKRITLDQVKEYMAIKPSELWQYYNPNDTKHYAADVPHLFIKTRSRVIPPQYIVFGTSI